MKQLTIAQRITISTGVLVALLLALAGFARFEFTQVEAVSTEITGSNIPGIVGAGEFAYLANANRVSLVEFVFNPDPAARAELRRRIETYAKDINRTLDTYEAAIHTEKDAQLFARVREARAAFAAGRQRIWDFAERDDLAGAREFYLGTFDPIYDAYITSGRALLSYNVEAAAVGATQLADTINLSQNTIAITSVVGLVLGVLISALAIRAINRALKVTGKVLGRVSELKTLYADPTKNATELANYDAEFDQLKSQLTSLAAETFNTVDVFAQALTTQVSEDGTQTVDLSAKNLATNTATVTSAADLSAVTLDQIKTALEAVATDRATNGAEQSRLGFASEVLTVNKANLEAANSRIVDVGVAEESTQLARWNKLVQAGTAMLAQANDSAQTALRLLS
jgi:flagellin